MATAAAKNTKYTISGVLKSLKQTGQYAHPSSLEPFYKMAKSRRLLYSISDPGFHPKFESVFYYKFYSPSNSPFSLYSKGLFEIDEQIDFDGRPSSESKLTLHELDEVVEKCLNGKEISNKTFAYVFKRVTMNYFKYQSALSDKQFLELEKIDEQYPELTSLIKAFGKKLNELTDEKICIIAHLIYLGKICSENTPKTYYSHPDFSPDYVILTLGKLIYATSKKEDKRRHAEEQTHFILPTLVHIMLGFWKEKLKFIPAFSNYGRRQYDRIYGISEKLEEQED